MKVEKLGDEALRWIRPEGVDPGALLAALRAHPGVGDAVVTERHVAVYFDPSAPPDAPWEAAPRNGREKAVPRTHVIHVAYDGEDLADVARACGMTARDVVALHAAPTYEVAVVGFMPGFAYLRGLDARLVLPRRASPRARVPAGSVAIAAEYSGVYPAASPGGWHLLGRAIDFAPWSPEHGAALALGDRVRFEAVA